MDLAPRAAPGPPAPGRTFGRHPAFAALHDDPRRAEPRAAAERPDK